MVQMETLKQKINQNGHFKNLDAFDLSLPAISGTPPKVIQDNAGALWHAVSTPEVYNQYGGKIQAAEQLLTGFHDLLDDSGLVVTDYSKIGLGASTGEKLADLFSREEDYRQFLTGVGFTPEVVQTDLVAALVLKKIT